MIHDWWAVELRRALVDTLRTPVPLRQAIEAALDQIADLQDALDDCVAAWEDVFEEAIPVVVVDVGPASGATVGGDGVQELQPEAREVRPADTGRRHET